MKLYLVLAVICSLMIGTVGAYTLQSSLECPGYTNEDNDLIARYTEALGPVSIYFWDMSNHASITRGVYFLNGSAFLYNNGVGISAGTRTGNILQTGHVVGNYTATWTESMNMSAPFQSFTLTVDYSNWSGVTLTGKQSIVLDGLATQWKTGSTGQLSGKQCWLAADDHGDNTYTTFPMAGSRFVTGKAMTYSGSPDPVFPDFVGYPTDGYAPLEVNFTISNFTSINATGPSWTFGDGQFESDTDNTITHTYLNPGLYTVQLYYYNTSGIAGQVTKPDYILASNESGMIVYVDVTDSITGLNIYDVNVGVKNTTTGVWRNGTLPVGQGYISTTDPGFLYPLTIGQNLTVAADKYGYKSASNTFVIPHNGYTTRLSLVPNSVINATGAGTVVANVISQKNSLPLQGKSVSIDTGQMGITNSAGTTTLYNVTAGARVAKVIDPNGQYLGANYNFNLTEGETKMIVIPLVVVGETPVTTYVSPTPTVTGTYNASDPNSKVYGNYSTTQINEQGGAGVLGMLMQLIQLWPLIVIGIFMKFMKSAFE